MKRSSFSVMLSFLLALLLGAASAGAEMRAGGIELNPFVGVNMFENNFTMGNRPVEDGIYFGGRLGYFFTKRLGGELTFGYSPTEVKGADRFFDMYSIRMEAVYNFMTCRVVPFMTVGGGLTLVDVENWGMEEGMDIAYGGGLKYFLTDDVSLRADVRHVFYFEDHIEPSSDMYNNIEFVLGFSYLFGGEVEDSDGDGVSNCSDLCAETSRGVPVDYRGCPTDSDFDGIVDGWDECPDTPRGVAVDDHGCSIQSAAASPVEEAPLSDQDGDGVPDGADQCPDTAAGIAVDSIGCPLDSDGDGIYDGMDQCPDTPPGERVDEAGCTLGWVLEGIQFAFDNSTITTTSATSLEKLVAMMNQNSDYRIVLEGHTDSRGPAEYNQKLSGYRAQSVKNYLVQRGIGVERIDVRGYGESQPVASNDTEAGRALNRRVEFKVLK